MVTGLMLLGMLVMWFIQLDEYRKTGRAKARRRSSSWGWALCGAVIGSFTGVAALGTAFAGTVPGALIGYLAASHLMKSENPSLEGLPDPTYDHLGREQLKLTLTNSGVRVSQLLWRAVAIGGVCIALGVLIWLVGATLNDAGYFARYKAEPIPFSPAPTPKFPNVDEPVKYAPVKTYETELNRLEAEHPQINPDSPQFDPKLTRLALDTLKGWVNTGANPADALERSVMYAIQATSGARRPIDITPPEFKEPNRPRTQSRGAAAASKRPCEYKDVMSDDDYRACGATPPH